MKEIKSRSPAPHLVKKSPPSSKLKKQPNEFLHLGTAKEKIMIGKFYKRTPMKGEEFFKLKLKSHGIKVPYCISRCGSSKHGSR